LAEPPYLVSITPDGRNIPIKLSKANDDKTWQGRLLVGLSIPSGVYTYSASARTYSGSASTYIAQGSRFSYIAENNNPMLICYPNPFKPDVDKYLKFRPPGYSISIYSINGELVKKLQHDESEWDGMNDYNQPVVSGIYFYIAEGNGITRKGKIAVIW
jgi:flagellar hook assembly protein FlgD